MIYIGDKEIVEIYMGNKALSAIYKGDVLLWEADNGAWLNEKPWINNAPWKEVNHQK